MNPRTLALPLALAACFNPGSGDSTPATTTTAASTSTTAPGDATTDAPDTGSTSAPTTTSSHDDTTTTTADDTTSTSSSSTLPPDLTTGTADTGESSSGPPTDAVCGNLLVESGEECDDGSNRGVVDGCDACKRNARFAFLSTFQYPGNILSLEYADAQCQTEAAALVGYADVTFVAWLSSKRTHARDRIGTSKLPYIRRDTQPLGLGVGVFSTGVLAAPISVTVFNDEVAAGSECSEDSSHVWTFTDQSGMAQDVCTLDAMQAGSHGLFTAADVFWTAACVKNCALLGRIYCIEKASL